MKIYKKSLIRVFFALEIIIFVTFYFFGENGLRNIKKVKTENGKLLLQEAQLKEEIEKIEKEIKTWKSSDFYKEKYARERLQMAREGDQIYFIN